jgi:hypothetical protein
LLAQIRHNVIITALCPFDDIRVEKHAGVQPAVHFALCTLCRLQFADADCKNNTFSGRLRDSVTFCFSYLKTNCDPLKKFSDKQRTQDYGLANVQTIFRVLENSFSAH